MIELALAIGSVIAGWFGFWQWLFAPAIILFVTLYLARRELLAEFYDDDGFDEVGSERRRLWLRHQEISAVVGSIMIHAVTYGLGWGLSALF